MAAARALVVQWESGEPIYGQIARQLRGMIASGSLPPGSRLPPVRVVASDLGVNLNTVARAYRQLEEEGFVEVRERQRAVVLPPPSRPARADRRRFEDELRGLLGRMRQAGFAFEEIERIARREIAALARGWAKPPVREAPGRP